MIVVCAKDTAPAAFVTYIRAILLRDTGATISPVHSFIFLQGLETLSLRVERHVENALKVVQYLKDQPLVEKVNHPSISTNEEQQALYNEAELLDQGIKPNTIRLSIGTENIDDIIEDLDEAFKALQ